MCNTNDVCLQLRIMIQDQYEGGVCHEGILGRMSSEFVVSSL